jgi:hypothetical protein
MLPHDVVPVATITFFNLLTNIGGVEASKIESQNAGSRCGMSLVLKMQKRCVK